MKYNFDEVIDRRNTGSLKWNVGEEELPMWVADMDFKIAPEIQEAIRRKAAFGLFGYEILPKEWQEAYRSWWGRRHQFPLEKEWLLFGAGVVPAIASIVRKMTCVGENVLVQPPVYPAFYNCIRSNGRNVAENPLIYVDGEYRMDFEDLEKKLKEEQTTMMILCNPHNPSGNIWDQETLSRIGSLCEKYHVLVVSDEIHCDLTAPGADYVTYASASEACRMNSITCMAPSKTFNMAGLQTSAISVPNPWLRHRVAKALQTDGIDSCNSFAAIAAVAAFEKGEEWLDELQAYVQQNREYARDFLEKELPMLHLVPARATYLLWLDCSKVTEDAAEFAGFIRQHSGLFVSDGTPFGGNGNRFLRVNIACPRVTLQDGLLRLKSSVEAYLSRERD